MTTTEGRILLAFSALAMLGAGWSAWAGDPGLTITCAILAVVLLGAVKVGR